MVPRKLKVSETLNLGTAFVMSLKVSFLGDFLSIKFLNFLQ